MFPIMQECSRTSKQLCIIKCELSAVNFQNKTGMIDAYEIRQYFLTTKYPDDFWTENDRGIIPKASDICGPTANNNKTVDSCTRANNFIGCLHGEIKKLTDKLNISDE